MQKLSTKQKKRPYQGTERFQAQDPSPRAAWSSTNPLGRNSQTRVPSFQGGSPTPYRPPQTRTEASPPTATRGSFPCGTRPPAGRSAGECSAEWGECRARHRRRAWKAANLRRVGPCKRAKDKTKATISPEYRGRLVSLDRVSTTKGVIAWFHEEMPQSARLLSGL